jgi:hypothetical protein
VDRGFYGVAGVNMGGKKKDGKLWREKGILGILNPFYVDKMEKFDNKNDDSDDDYDSDDSQEVKQKQKVDPEIELEEKIQKFERDIA